MRPQEARTTVRHARCELADRIQSLTPEVVGIPGQQADRGDRVSRHPQATAATSCTNACANAAMRFRDQPECRAGRGRSVPARSEIGTGQGRGRGHRDPPGDRRGPMQEGMDLGIQQVWMHRGPGAGSVSSSAAAYGRERGITVIDGGCPCRFDPTADFGHKMRAMLTLTGKIPTQGVRCRSGGTATTGGCTGGASELVGPPAEPALGGHR
jgi:hypothetical protein